MSYKRKDLTGQRFGKLTAIQDTGKSLRRSRLWLCQCDCGRTTEISASELGRGRIKSCGKCHHSQSYTKLYQVWVAMKQRCLNENDANYHNYGGRGITLCEAWMNYVPFFEWATAAGYAEGKQIDRIDNDKGYSPENCRFVTPLENTNNRRNTIRVEINGESYTLRELAEKHGINYKTISERYRQGDRGEDLIAPWHRGNSISKVHQLQRKILNV